MDRGLLRRFLEVYPFQPATAVWRAAEVSALAHLRFSPGLGLDLGCGDGRLTRVLVEQLHPMRLVGLDIDPLETALAENEHLYERVHTSSGDRIPETDGAFDFAISVSVMEHIPALEPVLRELARVLKPGGRLVATVPSAGFHACLRGPVLPGIPRDAYLRALDVRVAHLRYWTIAEWRSALAAAGLRLTSAQPIMSCSEIRRWEGISRLTAGMLHVVMKRRHPIEIQRSLGLRRSGQQLPRIAAKLLGRILAAGIDSTTPTDEMACGCLLIEALKPQSAVQ